MPDSHRSWDVQARVTLWDVAKAAGVSQSAASVVLNGAKSGTGVSAGKRQLILEAAANLGYRPNAVARALSTGRTHRIGFYANDFTLDRYNYFYADILGGILTAAKEMEVSTTVHTAGINEAALLSLVTDGSIDGLIIHRRVDDPIMGLRSQFRVPAVAVVDATDSMPSVTADDANGGELIAHHLKSLGHKHVLIRKSALKEPSAVERTESFERSAISLGMRVSVSYSPDGDQEGLETNDLLLLSRQPDRATAVVAWCDHVAVHSLNTLTDLGIAVPESVAVVGFDGYEFKNLSHELTTIRVPWGRVAFEATKILERLILGQEVPSVTKVPVEFVRGTTT